MNLKVDNASMVSRLHTDPNVYSEYNLLEKVVAFLDDNDTPLSYSEIVNMLRHEVIKTTWDSLETKYYELYYAPTFDDKVNALQEQTSVIWFDEEEVIFLKF